MSDMTRLLHAAEAGDPHAEADRAMEWLKKAVATGYNDFANIKKDSDLDFLRGREDFKKLLADLEARESTAKK
jgi:hypothetical protein